VGMLANTRTVRIEWGDCDPMGIVYFPRYLAIFDDCTTHLFEHATGITKLDMLQTYDFTGFPMVDLRAKFMIASKCGDDVVIESTIAAFRRSSFDVRHRLRKAGELAAEGFETRVWVGRHPGDPTRIKSQPIPDGLKERFTLT
jgi:4-hydroxybenzoyl-CoA thioesterase